MIYGYARISDKSQNLNSQLDELEKFGVDEIIQEVITGVSPVKDGLDALVEKVERGDSIIVTRMDRLGRSTVQLLQLIETLEKKTFDFEF
ncbi:recombinase family protein (plasmid) [Paenibacillus urinalis]|nr:recombinase family protein [Paenibacillus urinalis]WDI00130.1 recombinase family protein [Paenibacillus urinalis]